MDMKVEMGSIRKAIIRSGISFNKLPNKQKQKDTSTNERQKNNFAGTAKKRNRKDKMAQRSLVAVEVKDSVSDSNEDTQPAFGGVEVCEPTNYQRSSSVGWDEAPQLWSHSANQGKLGVHR